MLAGGSVFAQFGGGSGTSSDPYIIKTSAHLTELATGSASTSYENVYFKISDDFSGGTLATPIGTNANPFKGNFDGNGKMIDITKTVTTMCYGIFGYAGDGANIHDVNVKGSITGGSYQYIGGIVGYAYGTEKSHITILNCTNSASISGTGRDRGGIAGYIHYVDILGCSNTASISGSQFLGGIAGTVLFSSVTNCINNGSLTATNSASNVGGICGHVSVDATKVQSFVSGCTNSGTISGGGSAGGILGYSKGQNNGLVEVSNCTNKGDVTGTSSSIGGIIGNNTGFTYIANCDNAGTVSGKSKIGGIVGNATYISIIEDCSNSGDIIDIGTNSGVGGIVGYISGSSSSRNTISRCTNSGKVTSSSYNVGGVLGFVTYTDVNQCSNSGVVAATNYAIGGVIGRTNYCTADQCSNTGTITSSKYDVGGVVAYLNNSSLLNSYNRGDVTTTTTSTSTSNSIGGVVGQINTASSTVFNCYNTGIVSASNTTQFCVGGIAGRMYNGSVANCYNGGTIDLNASNTGYSGNILGSNGGSSTVQYCYYRTNMGAGTRIQGTSGTATASNCKAFAHTSESDADCTFDIRSSNDLVDALNYWRTDISGTAASYLEWYDDTEASGWNNLGMPEFYDDTYILPIELISFTANCNGKSSLIEWTTATEKNNDFFVLERSTDAINFNEIARIAGAGNSIEPLNYAYTDYCARSGDNYYRFVQVDYDGTSTASEIIVANCPAEALGEPDVLAFPNPFDDNLTLHFENFGNIQATVEVYDMLGRMVHTQKINCSQNDYEVVLRLAGLADGTYNVRIRTKEFVINRQVIKN